MSAYSGNFYAGSNLWEFPPRIVGCLLEVQVSQLRAGFLPQTLLSWSNSLQVPLA